ncbi:MAG TPA: nuclear transport factor 2 family protein [Gemmatimonadota bacterium]|nr:nuclear transport factor 2 family protein [Gemmatimonadota bacterium]
MTMRGCDHRKGGSMKALILTAVLTLLTAGQLRAQDGVDAADWESALRAAEARHVAAVLSNDVEAWDALLENDFIVNSPRNTVVEKAELLELVRSGWLTSSSFEQEIEAVRRFGDVAVVMGEDRQVWAPQSPNAGQTHCRRFTDIWRLDGGQWRYVARQATLVSCPMSSDPSVEGAP